MSSALLILPDFLLILLGALLRRKFFDDDFWKPAEKLVFYVLLPPLLFLSVAEASVTPGEAGHFLAVALGTMLTGILLAYGVRAFVRSDDLTHASVFQCGFRFNTYIGFAVAAKLFGDEGTSLLALLIAFWVPVSNAVAVSVLAAAVARAEAQCGANEKGSGHRGTSLPKAVLTNPLILATLAGLAVNLSGFPIPTLLADLCRSLGNASLALGLLCIGAGLRAADFRANPTLIAASAVDRLLLLPLVAWGAVTLFGLDGSQAGIALLFAALPTAQSCFVMTAAMRGNAAAVANVTTVQTLLSMVTLPFWIILLLEGWAA